MYYSRDGHSRTIFQRLHPLTGDIIEMPLYWGNIFKFVITFKGSVYIHRFTVTEYINEELYLLHHTVYPTTLVRNISILFSVSFVTLFLKGSLNFSCFCIIRHIFNYVGNFQIRKPSKSLNIHKYVCKFCESQCVVQWHIVF